MKIILLSLSLVLGLSVSLFSQSITKVNGSYCVNSDATFIATTSCTSFTWSISGGTESVDYEVIGSKTASSFHVKWKKAFTASIECSCSGYGFMSLGFRTIASAVPAVQLSVSPTSGCVNVTTFDFKATPTNGGNAPYYQFYIDNLLAYGGSSNSYSTKAVPAGIHSAYVVMTSNAECPSPTGATSPTSSFTINPKTFYTVKLYGPDIICSSSTAASTFVAIAEGSSGTLTYEWYVNDAPLATTSLNTWTRFVQADERIYCKVYSDAICINSPATSNTYKVVLTSAVTPSVDIFLERTNFCHGEQMNLTASSKYLTSTSAFSWKLANSEFATTRETSLKVSVDRNEANAFSPGDVVTVTANGLSGTCLTSTSGSGSTASVTFSINPIVTPSVLLTPITNPICAGAAVTLATKSNFAGSAPNYNLVLDGREFNSNRTGEFILPSNLVSGPHVAQVMMTSIAPCATQNVVPSNQIALVINQLPVAELGPDRTITLPLDNLVLESKVTDADGGNVSYSWIKTQGTGGSLSGTSTSSLAVSNLSAGTYEFQLASSDQCASSFQKVKVNVLYPDNNYNYVKEESMHSAGYTDVVAARTAPLQARSTVINYFDGFGRALQTVNQQASPDSLDLVTPYVYDVFGRKHREYLPFTGQKNGWCKPINTIIGSSEQYIGIAQPFYARGSNNKIADDDVPYSRISFEASPLNRVTSTLGVGQNWSSNSKASQQLNLLNQHGIATNQEKITAWKVNTATGLPEKDLIKGTDGYYNQGDLRINVTIDEQGNIAREYSDKEGHIVLKKMMVVQGSTDLNNKDHWASTYYIYDSLGNLVMVIPPEGTRLLAN